MFANSIGVMDITLIYYIDQLDNPAVDKWKTLRKLRVFHLFTATTTAAASPPAPVALLAR
jgi:hypothetical protein